MFLFITQAGITGHHGARAAEAVVMDRELGNAHVCYKKDNAKEKILNNNLAICFRAIVSK